MSNNSSIAITNKRTSSFGSAIIELLSEKKNIIVLVGAGISVSCGIPDFRSSQGLYNTLRCEEIDENLATAEDLFHLDFFEENPTPFYKFAALQNLFAPRTPSSSHLFLKLLEEHSMLLRVYTQNIDGLEELAGVSGNRVVYAHGSLKWAQCMTCQSKVDSTYILQQTMQMDTIVPKCSSSKRKLHPKKRSITTTNGSAIHRAKRSSTLSTSSTATNDSDLCNGVMKPCITFFGEKLHSNVNRFLQADQKKVDALIVIGTSLSVAPMSQVMDYLPANIPRILINRNYLYAAPSNSKYASNTTTKDAELPPLTSIGTRTTTNPQQVFHRSPSTSTLCSSLLHRRLPFDAYLLGDCDIITSAIAQEFGWETPKITTTISNCSSLDSTTLANTFLFPGAVLVDSKEEFNSSIIDDKEEGEEREDEYMVIIHCDGCNNKILASMKCNQCFDYDLCYDCYPSISKKHFRGKHTFSHS